MSDQIKRFRKFVPSKVSYNLDGFCWMDESIDAITVEVPMFEDTTKEQQRAAWNAMTDNERAAQIKQYAIVHPITDEQECFINENKKRIQAMFVSAMHEPMIIPTVDPDLSLVLFKSENGPAGDDGLGAQGHIKPKDGGESIMQAVREVSR